VRARPNLPNHSRKSNIVVLQRPRKKVQQEDLEEVLFLEREMHESTARWKVKRDYILELLKSGATIEPGVHTAEIESKLKVR